MKQIKVLIDVKVMAFDPMHAGSPGERSSSNAGLGVPRGNMRELPLCKKRMGWIERFLERQVLPDVQS